MKDSLTGYASKDKPWLKYYDMRPEDVSIPDISLYEYIYNNNKNNLNDIALNYYHRKITYKELFENVDDLTSKGEILSAYARTLCDN